MTTFSHLKQRFPRFSRHESGTCKKQDSSNGPTYSMTYLIYYQLHYIFIIAISDRSNDIMLIMQKWAFLGPGIFYKARLIRILYFHYVWYRTDARTQFRENRLRSQKTILTKKNANNVFFNFLNFFGPAVFCRRFYPFYWARILGLKWPLEDQDDFSSTWWL